MPILRTRHTGRANIGNIGSSQSVNDEFDGDSPGPRTSLMPSVSHVHSEWELEIQYLPPNFPLQRYAKRHAVAKPSDVVSDATFGTV